MGKRKLEEAPQGQDRDVTRRLVDVLATLSLVNAAELRDLTATVPCFKTYLVPGSESVSEAMAEAGRISWRNQEHARSRARRQTPKSNSVPRTCMCGVAFLRSLAATRELAPEHVAVLKSYWESNVVKNAPVQLAAHVRHC